MLHPENLIPAKKGEIRNPFGKKSGTKNRSTIARQILELSCTLPKKQFDSLKEMYPDITETMTNEEIMTIVQTGRAIVRGDVQSYVVILDSAYGKPAQDISIANHLSDDLLERALIELGAIKESENEVPEI